MTEEEIISNVNKLWRSVQKDRDFSSYIAIKIIHFLEKKIDDFDDIKDLGTELYQEVGRSNYPNGDSRRDGIRSMSHFVMGYWDMKLERFDESKKRLSIALANMKLYFEKRST